MQINNTREIKENQDSKILNDVSNNGKVRPWKEKKLANVSYAEMLEILKIKKYERVRQCGEVLEFKQQSDGSLKLFKAWFCKSKLCPVCNWRRAMKNSWQAQRVVSEVIKEKPKARWFFLTLSTKNAVDGETLNKAVSEMTKAFDKLMRYKKIEQNLIGFMRTTEVTVNKTNGTYNQHLHVLLCMENKYFRGKENYIEQAEWVKFWKRALKVNYDPVAHIKVIAANKKNDTAIVSAIKETSKYSVKESDYLTDNHENNLEIIQDLEIGLHGKRMISYGGLLKKIHQQLKLDDEDNNLINTTDDEKISEEDEKANSIIAVWNFEKQNYYRK